MSLSTVKTLKVNKWKSNKNIHKLLMQLIDFISISHIFPPSIQSIPTVYKDVYQFIYFLSVIYVCLAILMWGVLGFIICIWYLILPRIDFMYLLHFSYVVCTSRIPHTPCCTILASSFFCKNKNFPTSLFKTIVKLCKLFLFPLHVLLRITEWNRVLSGLL